MKKIIKKVIDFFTREELKWKDKVTSKIILKLLKEDKNKSDNKKKKDNIFTNVREIYKRKKEKIISYIKNTKSYLIIIEKIKILTNFISNLILNYKYHLYYSQIGFLLLIFLFIWHPWLNSRNIPKKLNIPKNFNKLDYYYIDNKKLLLNIYLNLKRIILYYNNKIIYKWNFNKSFFHFLKNNLEYINKNNQYIIKNKYLNYFLINNINTNIQCFIIIKNLNYNFNNFPSYLSYILLELNEDEWNKLYFYLKVGIKVKIIG